LDNDNDGKKDCADEDCYGGILIEGQNVFDSPPDKMWYMFQCQEGPADLTISPKGGEPGTTYELCRKNDPMPGEEGCVAEVCGSTIEFPSTIESYQYYYVLARKTPGSSGGYIIDLKCYIPGCFPLECGKDTRVLSVERRHYEFTIPPWRRHSVKITMKPSQNADYDLYCTSRKGIVPLEDNPDTYDCAPRKSGTEECSYSNLLPGTYHCLVVHRSGYGYEISSSCKDCHISDVNMDGKVNILDISKVARAFGSHGPGVDENGNPKPGEPPSEKWDQEVDLHQDKKINIVDIALVAVHFGKEYGCEIL
jgi:hypothetical protein